MTAVRLVDRDAWIGAVLASDGLSATAKNVAVRIGLHVNRQTGRCDPAVSTIAAGVGLTVRPVEKAIATLERGGWLARGRGVHRSNSYALRLPEGVNPVPADGVATVDPVALDVVDPVPRDGVGEVDPVQADGVEALNPVRADGSTPSRGTGSEPGTPSRQTGVPRPAGRTNLESNQRTPLTPQAARQPDPSKGLSGRILIATDDPRWPVVANAHRRRNGRWPPRDTFTENGIGRIGWKFDASFVAQAEAEAEADAKRDELRPIPPGYRPPYADAAE